MRIIAVIFMYIFTTSIGHAAMQQITANFEGGSGVKKAPMVAFANRFYGYFDYESRQDGYIRMHLLLTNGEKWKGNRGCYIATFRNDDASKKIVVNFVGLGVNPRDRRDEHRSYKIDPDVLKSLTKIDIKWERCPRPDGPVILDAILQVGAAVAGAYLAPVMWPAVP